MSKKNLYFAYRSFWPEIETMKRFRECGIDTFCFTISNTTNSLGSPYTKYPPVWKWYNVYDFDIVDRQIGDILQAIPDARLICQVDLNTPHWWVRFLGAFGNRYDTFYELGKIGTSTKWREETSTYLSNLLPYLESRYGNNIVAYTLGCGGATEWHDRSAGEESIYRLSAYRKWCALHGKPLRDIPGRLRRDQGSHDRNPGYVSTLSYFNGTDPTGCYNELFPDGTLLFRDPRSDEEVIDYWKFCNESNVETISYFLEKTREIIRPEVELGLFFGYLMGDSTLVSTGHLEYEKMLEHPALDFISAPIGYGNRGMGGSPSSCTVGESIRLRGKRMLQEMDQRTWCSNRRITDYYEMPDPLKVSYETAKGKNKSEDFVMAHSGIWRNEEEAIAGIRRDGSAALIRSESLWWFDMWGGFYQGEAVFAAFKEFKEIWDKHSRKNYESVAEILVVVTPENIYYLNDKDARCGLFHGKIKEALAQSSLPYDTCSFDDLEHLDTTRYRLVIMCHPFSISPEQETLLEQRLLNTNRAVLWLYGPGVIDQGTWNPPAVERWTGAPLGTPGIQKKDFPEWKSRCIHDPLTITTEVLRSLAQEAGCHIYCDAMRPVFANRHLIAIHTREAETITLNLPRHAAYVTDLFSNLTFQNTAGIELVSTGPTTWLLHYQNS